MMFKDDRGREHQYAFAMELLAGDGAVYRERLYAMGLDPGIGIKARQRLQEYITATKPAARATSVSRLGWHSRAFIMPDATFGNINGERVVYQPVRQDDHNFRTAGTLEEWQTNVATRCRGNSRLAFALSCAFAAPCLYLVDGESGGFHFRGESSVGKSTAQYAAGSVVGGGGIKGYLKTWLATISGLEGTIVTHSDNLLILDEINQADAKAVGQGRLLISKWTR